MGKMKHVKAFDEDILLSNVNGTIYATTNRCGHQNASLAKGTLNGDVVTCPLHAATFDVRTGKNLTGRQLMMPPEVMQKLPPEMLVMFKKTGEILGNRSPASEDLCRRCQGRFNFREPARVRW